MSKTTPMLNESEFPGLARCIAERARAERLVTQSFKGTELDRKSLALKRGCEAYRSAMPLLTSQENIRDFIACFTHGMVEEIFYQWEADVYLSVARAALRSFQLMPKAQKEVSKGPVISEKKEKIVTMMA